jgi:hypothetical protein
MLASVAINTKKKNSPGLLCRLTRETCGIALGPNFPFWRGFSLSLNIPNWELLAPLEADGHAAGAGNCLNRPVAR